MISFENRRLSVVFVLLLFIGACESKKNTDSKYTLTPDGKFVFLLNKEKSSSDVDSSAFFPEPFGVTFSYKSGKIYVASIRDHQIYVFDKNLAVLGTIGMIGQGPGELLSPAFPQIYGDELYVVEYGNNRISRFTLDGRFIATLKASIGLGGNNYVVDSHGRIHVFDPASTNLISVLKENGEIDFSYGELMDRQGHNVKNLNRPLLCVDEFDNIYVIFITSYKTRKYNRNFSLEWERDYSNFPAFESYQNHLAQLEKSRTLSVGKKSEGKHIANTSYFALAHDCVFRDAKLYVIYAGHAPHGYGVYEIDASNGDMRNIYLFSHKKYRQDSYLVTHFCFNDDGSILGVDRREGQVILFNFQTER